MIEFIKTIEGNVKFFMIMFWVLFIISLFFIPLACDKEFKDMYKHKKEIIAVSIALFIVAVVITNFYIYFYCQTKNT
jgi:hypothetical protein